MRCNERHIGDARQVAIEDATPLFHRELDQLLPKVDAGVVDQDVDAVEGLHDVLFEFADLFFLDEICLKDLRLPPRFSTACFTSFNCSVRRETSAMLAPAAPSAKAIALPIPLLAPVMTATLPLRLYSLIAFSKDCIHQGCRLRVMTPSRWFPPPVYRLGTAKPLMLRYPKMRTTPSSSSIVTANLPTIT